MDKNILLQEGLQLGVHFDITVAIRQHCVRLKDLIAILVDAIGNPAAVGCPYISRLLYSTSTSWPAIRLARFWVELLP